MTRHGEKAAGLALLPPLATIGFYLLPTHWQSQLVVQWVPQLIAYLALGFWAFHNVDRRSKLGLESDKIKTGLGWGAVTGIILGCVNTAVILFLVPAFGEDIDFLRHTPHAHIPVLDHGTVVYPHNRHGRRTEFSGIPPRQVACPLFPYQEQNWGFIATWPAPGHPIPFRNFGTHVFVRSLYGLHLPPFTLDCRMGWIHLGIDMDTNEQPLCRDHGPCHGSDYCLSPRA